MKHCLTVLLLCTFCMQGTPSAAAADITNYPKLNAPDLWQALVPDGDAAVMRPEEIRSYNRKIIAASPSVYDLTTYAASVSAAKLRQWTATNALDGTLYQNGRAIDRLYRDRLLAERNLEALRGENPVTFGVVVRRANLRALPTNDGLFDSPSDRKFDVLQETAVDPSEPLLILHTSASGAFHYVQTRNYRGWMAAIDIAQTDRAPWLRYAAPQSFLVVTANRFALAANGERILFQMGAKLPLLGKADGDHAVLVPKRTPQGALAETTMRLPAALPDLHEGFLPYTRNQILRQAFRFLHDPYGWGGLEDSVDCSSFIADIYRTVGVELPRNADTQELTAGVHTPLWGLSEREKLQKLQSLRPGDALFFSGHTMLYLGETNGTPFILHALGSHTRHTAGGGREKIRTMQVVVSDLSLRRYRGETFTAALTSAISYRN